MENPDFNPAGSGGESDGDAAVQVSNLRVVWVTPNQVRWEWDAGGSADELFGYELVTGPSDGDVREESPSSTVWTAEQNPELGRYFLPRTGGEEQVTATVTDLHDVDSVVVGQLRAIDTAGRQSSTNVAMARTAGAPVAELVIFSDEDTPGFSIPGEFALSSEAPFEGTRHYQFVSPCSTADCWENLRRQEMFIDLSAISEGDFVSTAYLELALSSDATPTAWWASVWLWYDGSDQERIANYDGWTVRSDGRYRVLQVPMRAFEIAGRPTPYEELALGLFGFNVGGSWANGATVRVDEVVLRW